MSIHWRSLCVDSGMRVQRMVVARLAGYRYTVLSAFS